ncbi:MAG: alpha/beta hydrolase [Coxiellaceae bacterium]|nr:MAG: alpha/beta hydrolase [Coxiellaceae bacterium]
MPYASRKDGTLDIKIYYEVVGKGRPIVFHHGNGNSSKDWHTLGYVAELATECQLILIDSRGYGKSSKPHDPAAYNLFSRAADTIAVLDELNVEKAHCLGGSIGAAMCMILAKYYPERFLTYIFATPYFVQFDENIKQALLRGPSAYLAKLEELMGEKFENESIRETFLANDTQAVWAANSSEWFEYLDYIKYINTPSLIYVGSKEPSLAEVVSFAKKVPQSEIQIFPNIDHARLYWDGKLVAPLIKNFVKKHSQ